MSTTTDGPGGVLGTPLGVGNGDPEAEDRPLADRLERDPSNLGGEVADDGDVVYPTPDPSETHL
jgi:hypothetical protein